jgi:hypothetical protein
VAGPAPAAFPLNGEIQGAGGENSIPGSLVTQSIGPFPNYLEALVDVGMGNLGEYVFKKEGEVMAMNLSQTFISLELWG